MVDPHVHLRDLVWSHKATFASETKAAVAGGYWAVMDMPNTPPSTTSVQSLNIKKRSLERQAYCDWGVYFGASQADNTAEYSAIATSACGLKMFCNDTTGDLLIEDQSEREKHFNAWQSGKIIAVHAEGETVREILDLVRVFRKPTHFLHISTAEELYFLKAAKEEGLPVTVGVCPHHLYLTENDLTRLKGFGMMKPSLKTQADVDALWEGIVDGVVDVVESDHAPHTIEEKTGNAPAYGVPGLETTLPLMLTAVHDNRLDLQRLIDLVATNPRRIWNLPCPEDTFVTVQLDESYVLNNDILYSACGWTPFEGMRVFGKVRENRIRGTKVFDGDQFLVAQGFGEDLFQGTNELA